ncbi:MAG: SET domain-containing protein-lysine N-methyltransferase [Candidatus Hodarchaeota archaeon]
MHEYISVKYISEKKGRGAFARKNIKKGALIDNAPVILIPNDDYLKIQDTIIYHYCYIWADPKHMPEFENAVTFSKSQFINHSYKPNVAYYYDYENKSIQFEAIRNISKGEELTMNYNGKVDDKTPVWFEVED